MFHRAIVSVLAVVLLGSSSPAATARPGDAPDGRAVDVEAVVAKRAQVLVAESLPDGARRWLLTDGRNPRAVQAGTRIVANTEHHLHGQTEPLFGDQWALANTGQSGGTPGADVDALRAWELTTGSETTVVAVLDSGADVAHPEIADRILVNPAEIAWNGIDDDGNGYVDDRWGYDFFDGDADVADDNGHGTFISGIIAAEMNGDGIVGLAPDIALLIVRVCGSGLCFTGDIIAGIEYAIARGADVINMSFGSDSANPALEDAIVRAADAGIVIVASAGNEGHDNDTAADGPPIYPASYPQGSIVAVTSTDRSDEIPTDPYGSFEVNYGATTVDLGAPGSEIVSLYPGGGYAEGSGSSFAAPHVSAALALMHDISPTLGPLDLASRVIAAADPVTSLSGRTSSGGRLNAYRAVGAAMLSDIVVSEFFDDILWLYEQGITRGCNPPANDRFCPDRTVTRGEMAAFLSRALGLPPATGDHFVDDETSVFEADIDRLHDAGITRGCNPPASDRFCPDRTVTRSEMAAFLVRAFGYVDSGEGDWFVDDDGSMFEDSIDRLRVAGVTRGCNPPANDRFCPDGGVTRGQMAAFLRRALAGQV